MAENQGQTVVAPVNTHPAPAQNPQSYPNVQYPGPAGPPPHLTFEVPQEHLGTSVPAPAPTTGSQGGFVQKLKTPVAAAVIAGALLLGVGFATGYVVGHDRGSASVSGTTDGQTGFGGGQMPGGGQFPGGGQMPGGQTGQGQTGQGQSGSGTSPFGQGQSQDGTTQDGTTQDGTTQGGATTQDSTDLSQTQ
ncbi:hypothetical protein LWF15_32110 [Kineosporia rhizophila]|uniref:hypothetical protein n=1 Tax=Kineosporia TaxID=49184 RepID=UPI001E4DF8A1|nr:MULTISPECIES: hypothetical protein [Kineosporia]MCE0540148.1 hypothetical protein [Kineosporia rhizophila]GLY14350.1 hypothetical protein Kisp01_13660 [Kineosporia sp. NBRC 101677]